MASLVGGVRLPVLGSARLARARRAAPTTAASARLLPQQGGSLAGEHSRALAVAVAPRARVAGNAAAPRAARGAAVCQAGSAGEAAPAATGTNWKLIGYFTLWYAYNIVFNLLNKSTLNVFPYPWLLASIQLASGCLWMSGMWLLRLHPVPVVPKEFWWALAPVALFHTIGHVSACVSFAQVAVSFTHVIKSAEPVFSVILSGILLGETYTLPVYLSLVPIVAGCSLAAMKEVSFNMGGFTGAMISNLGFVLRNIYSKQSLDKYKNIDGINLYALISFVGLLYLAPVAYLVEGSRWAAGYTHALTLVTSTKLMQMIAAGGVFYHLYNQVSYQALEGINPLAFSVGNTMKRVVVIASSVAFFKNPVSPLNALGSAIAILGTYLYTEAKRYKPKKA